MKNKEIEDLLKQLDDADDTAIEDSNFDVFNFLAFYNIQPGENLVKKDLLYSLYKKWSKIPVTPASFTIAASKYLPVEKTYFFTINESSFNITKKIIKLLKKHTKDFVKTRSYKNHFDNYLKYYTIEPGDYWIELDNLYHLYDKWTFKNKVQRILSKNQFYRFCKLYFKTRESFQKRVTWFSVNESIKQHFKYLESNNEEK